MKRSDSNTSVQPISWAMTRLYSASGGPKLPRAIAFSLSTTLIFPRELRSCTSLEDVNGACDAGPPYPKHLSQELVSQRHFIRAQPVMAQQRI